MTGPACHLCGLGCGRHPLTQRVRDVDRVFCCLGCENVYLILSESGAVASGQDLRQTELFKRSLALGLISREDAAKPPADSPDQSKPAEGPPPEEMLLQIGGMWCTSCAWLIEHALGDLAGVERAEASFASDLVKVNYHPQFVPPKILLLVLSNSDIPLRRIQGIRKAPTARSATC